MSAGSILDALDSVLFDSDSDGDAAPPALRPLPDPPAAPAELGDRDQAERPTLRVRADRLSHALFDVAEAAVASGDVDLNDVKDLLPKVHRIIEHAERLDAQKKTTDDYPVMHVSIIIDGGGVQMSDRAMDGPGTVADVIDMPELPKRLGVDAAGQRAADAGASPAEFSWVFEPTDEAGVSRG